MGSFINMSNYPSLRPWPNMVKKLGRGNRNCSDYDQSIQHKISLVLTNTKTLSSTRLGLDETNLFGSNQFIFAAAVTKFISSSFNHLHEPVEEYFIQRIELAKFSVLEVFLFYIAYYHILRLASRALKFIYWKGPFALSLMRKSLMFPTVLKGRIDSVGLNMRFDSMRWLKLGILKRKGKVS